MAVNVIDQNTQDTRIQLIGTSDELEIGLLQQVGDDIMPELVEVSESLADKFGPSARLNTSSIQKYFDYPNTFPFIARYHDEIIGYIIGVPLEQFHSESWALCDANLGKKNTIYTYAFAFKSRFHKTGFAKLLKRIFYNWMRKRGVKYISGHVVEGQSGQFSGDAEVLETFDNWHGTETTFEYYRRPIQNSHH